ncbi:MAG: type II and III secretion system protein family protein [Sphingomonadaceae bacterium]|nr:type II and III secretion system protein family protein [Sphingomonadaceae bacterium]
MNTQSILRHGALGGALAAALAAGLAAMPATPAAAATTSAPGVRPQGQITLSVGRGELVNLRAPMTDLFVADPTIADVQVRSKTQLYVFGKGAGQTSVYATGKSGAVIWSSDVRVGTNLDSIQTMLKLAMPQATITATPMQGLVLLTGTVAAPDDVEQAQRLVQAFVGKDIQVISRLATATPMQVNLHVKVAEVSRTFLKQIGMNLITKDTTGGFNFNVARGRSFGSIDPYSTSGLPSLDASSLYGLPAGSLSLPFNPATGKFITGGTTYNFSSLLKDGATTSLGLAGKLWGVDIMDAIDLAENDGLVTTLAQPNLTALSGETASFLAGGEIPIPVAQQLGQISIEYKQYGVSLAFTPIVLADGRISMRVRPEVSQLDYSNSVTIGGTAVPGLTTRRAETTIELGSGQSFMIGGLLSNGHGNTTNKAPFLGDLPVLGTLFRDNKFTRNETELVIVVTPYLVKPTSADQIALPTDGYKAATDFERILGGQDNGGKTGQKRPTAKMETPPPPVAQVGMADPAAPVTDPKDKKPKKVADAAPGFSFNN